MRWAFWRKRKPVHVGPTTVDWRPGDMAECLAEATDWASSNGPGLGSRWMVYDVFYGEADNGLEQGFALRLIGWGVQGFEASNFRKIVLDETGADQKVSKRETVRVNG